MSHQPPAITEPGDDVHTRAAAHSSGSDDRPSLKSTQDELRRAQEVNRRLLETMPCGVVQVDADGTLRSSNAEAQRILRMTWDELAGKHVSDWENVTLREDGSLMPVDEYPEMVCMRTGQAQGPVTLGIRFEDRTTAWMLYSAAPLLDPVSARITGAVVSFLDLTSFRNTQTELRDVEERYRQLVEFNPDAIFVHDGERFIYANAEAVRLYGAERPEDLLGRRVLDLVLPEDREFVADRIKNLLSSEWKHSPRRQTRILRLDGQIADVEPVGTRIQFAGKPAVQVVLHDISDRIRADNQLRASEERFRTLATVAPVGIYLTDPAGKPLYTNDRWYEIAGLDPQRDRGRGWVSAVHPDDRQRVNGLWQNALETGGAFEAEYRFLRPDGKEAWVMGQAVPHRDVAGRIAGFAGTITCITEHKRMEQALRLERERLMTVVTTAPLVLWSTDAQGTFTLSEGRGLELMGLKGGQSVGRSVFEMYADHAAIVNAHHRALAGESVVEVFEIQDLTFESRMVPLRGCDGQVTGVLGVAIDITQRRQAEQSMKQSEARLSAIIANTPTVAIEGYDSDGRVLFWNEAAQKMFGWSEAEAVGRKLDELMLTPVAARDFEALLRQLQRSAQPVPREWAYRNRQGQRGVCYSTVFAIPAEGGVTTFVCMDIDITQRKQAEESLHQSEERLRSIFQSAIDPLWDWDVVSDRTLHSPSWAKMLGYGPDELDESMQEWDSRVHPEDRPRVWDELRACLEGKSPDYEAVYRLRIRNGEWKWTLSRGRVVERDSRGKALRMIGSITDITERKKAEEAQRTSSNLQRLLLSELDHRVRNNLASLSALIDISARSQTNVQELARSIQGRVQAMATVHGLLSRGHWRTVWLESLIDAIVPDDLHPRVAVSGPEVLLPPRQVTAMGMVIQELTANSLKYGALAAPNGRLHVQWTSRPSRDDRHFVVELDWHERGGAPIISAGEPRVGTALVQGLVRSELRGEAILSYPPHGATHRFTIQIERAE